MIIKIIFIACITIVATIIVKQYKPELAFFIPVVGGLVIFSFMLQPLQEIVNKITVLGSMSGFVQSAIKPIFKIIGIGFLTEFASSLAEDSGLKSVAVKVLWAGKICVLLVCLPLLEQLFEIILNLL